MIKYNKGDKMTALKKRNIFLTIESVILIMAFTTLINIFKISFNEEYAQTIYLFGSFLITIILIFVFVFSLFLKENKEFKYYFIIILCLQTGSLVSHYLWPYFMFLTALFIKIFSRDCIEKNTNISVKYFKLDIIDVGIGILYSILYFMKFEYSNLFLVLMFFTDIIYIYGLFNNKYKVGFKRAYFIYFFSCLLLYFVGINLNIFEAVYDNIFIFIMIFCIYILSLSMNFIKYMADKYREQEKMMKDLVVMSNKLLMTTKEKENLQTSLLLNQIKPHFVYNVLNTISALCSIDPIKAEEMTVSFGKYLRSNMSSLNQQEIIGFENEIEHVKNYINLELIRFNAIEEKIEVIYDLQETNFYLPPLTIQPIVENAIKHGLREKEGKGVLKISSYVEDNFYCVCIEDNGVGFDPENGFSETSIGLENIRKRIKNVVKGRLDIQSKTGVGTKTTIKIIKDRIY